MILPSLIFRDAPWASQQKVGEKKRKAVPCIFRKKKELFARSCSHHTSFKELPHSQKPGCVNAGMASHFPHASLRAAFATSPG